MTFKFVGTASFDFDRRAVHVKLVAVSTHSHPRPSEECGSSCSVDRNDEVEPLVGIGGDVTIQCHPTRTPTSSELVNSVGEIHSGKLTLPRSCAAL
jgi:hypothetical protein